MERLHATDVEPTKDAFGSEEWPRTKARRLLATTTKFMLMCPRQRASKHGIGLSKIKGSGSAWTMQDLAKPRDPQNFVWGASTFE